ncbi:MAG: class I SAM-dependent methyltransferase [Desulfobacterales bacterium]|nr:class I SAM-dependent methyltransferase [Desulfobacterales bacterium]
MLNDSIYSNKYVESQAEKFRNRKTNHFANHIRLAKDLVRKYGPSPPTTILDLGCSIGTFAIEFALDGYRSIGLDLDQKAMQCGRELADELGCKPEWICSDAGNFELSEKVDMVICFDLLEHLDDNTISNMFSSIKKNLKKDGIFVFHTFPTQYNHVFYERPRICIPLIPFRKLSEKKFDKIVKWYTRFLDIFYLIRYGKTHHGVIQKTVHPNPLSPERVKSFLTSVGFEILSFKLGLDEINPLKQGQGVLAKKYLSHQTIALRSVWGVAKNS